MDLNKDLINIFKETNEQLRKKYNPIKQIGKSKIREALDIKKMNNLEEIKLREIHERGDIVGVDGSKNRVGNLYPHYLMAIKAMAKPMNLNKNPIEISCIYTPIISGFDQKDSEEEEKSIMARLEAKAAIKAIEEYTPYILMMDGSLMTYRIRCLEEWEKLKQMALDKNVLLIGVIEEIKTKELFTYLLKKKIDITEEMYDKEILFGVLEEGEYININPSKSKKNKEKIASCFLRTSTDPNVIGIDFLEDQRHYIEEICDIVYTLTPRDSRGIPIWLDIVDKEVKISDEMMKALVETYIDEDLSKIFLKAKRENRSL